MPTIDELFDEIDAEQPKDVTALFDELDQENAKTQEDVLKFGVTAPMAAADALQSGLSTGLAVQKRLNQKDVLATQTELARQQGARGSFLEGAIGLAQRALEPLTASGLLNQPARLAGEADPFSPGQPIIRIPRNPAFEGTALGGVEELAKGTIEGLTTPEMFVTIPALGASALARGLMAGEMAYHVPEQVAQGAEVLADPEANPQEKVLAVGQPIIGGLMAAGLAAGHAPAKNKPKALALDVSRFLQEEDPVIVPPPRGRLVQPTDFRGIQPPPGMVTARDLPPSPPAARPSPKPEAKPEVQKPVAPEGLTFDGVDYGGVKPEGLPPEMLARMPKQWAFTMRQPGSPYEGVTFYVKEGATPEEISARWEQKKAEFDAPKAPPVPETAPPVPTTVAPEIATAAPVPATAAPKPALEVASSETVTIPGVKSTPIGAVEGVPVYEGKEARGELTRMFGIPGAISKDVGGVALGNNISGLWFVDDSTGKVVAYLREPKKVEQAKAPEPLLTWEKPSPEEVEKMPKELRIRLGTFETYAKVLETGLLPDGKKASKKTLIDQREAAQHYKDLFEKEYAAWKAEQAKASEPVPQVEPAKPAEPAKPPHLMSPEEYQAATGRTPREAAHSQGMELVNARTKKLPLNAEAVDKVGMKLQEGYIREGDLYVFKEPAKPVEPAKPAATPFEERAKPWTTVKEEDISDAAASDKRHQVRVAEMRAKRDALLKEIKDVEYVVLPKRRSRFYPTKTKSSAKKADVERYRVLRNSVAAIEEDIRKSEAATVNDRRKMEIAGSAKLVNNPDRPLIHRLAARARMFSDLGERVPADLGNLLREMAGEEVNKRFKDLTAEESKTLTQAMERAAAMAMDLDKAAQFEPEFQQIFVKRNAELRAHVTKLKEQGASDLWSEEVTAKLDEALDQKYADGRNYLVPKKELTTKELADLKKLATEESSIALQKQKALEDEAKAIAAANAAKAKQLLDEAQGIVDSAPRTREAKAIKDELVSRIQGVVDTVISEDNASMKATNEPNEYVAGSDNGRTVRGTIEEKESGRFEVSLKELGTSDKEGIKMTVDTLADAERIFKGYVSVAQGKTVVAVPGDGIFILHKDGRSLVKLLRKALQLETGSEPGESSGPTARAKNPPKLAKKPDVKAATIFAAKKFGDKEAIAYAEAYSDGKRVVITNGKVVVEIKASLPEKKGSFPIAGVDEWVKGIVVEREPIPTTSEELWRFSRLGANLDATSVTILANKAGKLAAEAKDKEGNSAGWGDPRGMKAIALVSPKYLEDMAELLRKLGKQDVTISIERSKENPVLTIKAEGFRASIGMMSIKEAMAEPVKGPEGGIKLPDTVKELETFIGDREGRLSVMKEDDASRDQVRVELARAKAKLESLSSKSTGKPGEFREGSRPSSGAPKDIFEATDAELNDYFRAKFGDMGGSPSELSYNRSSRYPFPTYEAFKKWMDEQFTASNLEGLKGAYAEADTKWKISYIKENKTADALKREVIAHISVGAPLPAGFTPKSAPAPAPPPTPPGAPKPPPARQQPPPPPPRPPTPHQRFDVMALTQLFRHFSKFPTINQRLMRAFGRMIPGIGAVELKERLLWDKPLAERVLGHEIGHFIDLMISPSGKGFRFAKRFAPLRKFKDAFEKKELRAEAVALSTRWRGPFSKSDTYRNSAAELFADAMSALFKDPQMVNRDFPLIHDRFQDLRTAKPEFEAAYQDVSAWLRGDTLGNEWMKQQGEAVSRSISQLLDKTATPTASLVDKLKQAVVSVWSRVYEIEGKPRAIGDKFISKLERSHVWADKENALFYDQFIREVKPQLDKVDPNPLRARSFMHAMATAERVIHERRAGGQWIENNPVEARQLLEAVLDLSGPLGAKWKSTLDGAADSALYDLAAQIFRDIHDRGEPFKRRIAREIDELHLGVGGDAALNAFGVRGKLLNPGGLTPRRAAEVLAKLRSSMTPEQFQALRSATDTFRGMVYEVSRQAHAEGLISDRVFTELVQPNANTYMPFAVLDYWNGRVGAGILPQKGTAKDIADVTIAAQLKVASLNAWRQSQRQVKLLADAYSAGGLHILPGEELRRSTDIDRIRRKHRDDDISRAVLFVDGKPRLMEFPNDPGKTLEDAMQHQAFYRHLDLLHSMNRFTHGFMSLFTTFSPSFLGYRNPVRDFRTTANRVGVRASSKQLGELPESTRDAWNYAEAAFGGEMNPRIRDLVDKEVLMPPRLATSVVRDAANLRDLLENGSIMAYHLSHLRGEKWSKWKGGEKGRSVVKFAEKTFAAYEALAKIQAYQAGLAKGLSDSESQALARLAGIPNPGVSGKWSTPAEVFFPWLRVHIQGIRADLDTIRDPQLNRGFASRVVAFEVLPRVAKVAVASGIGAGLIKLASGSNEEKDPVIAEAFRRVSPYKMALDDVIPLALYDAQKGKYHFFWDFEKGADVPDHFEVVSWRIPSSEQGRLWGTLVYQMLSGLPMAKEDLARPGNGLVSNMGQWIRDYAVVGPNPLFETGSNLYDMAALGKNPTDTFSGRPAANDEMFTAGGADRAQAMAGYVFSRFGDAGALAGLMTTSLGLLDKRALNSIQRKIDGDRQSILSRIPLIKSMLSYDNYARYRDEKNTQLDEEQVRAKAKLIMTPEANELYQFYWRNVQRQQQLNLAEQVKFDVAKSWIKDVWGDSKTPGSIYSRAIHASSKDSSNEHREGVKADLDQLSAPYILQFKNTD